MPPAVTALTPTRIRALARQYGFRPSKALGQNFVVDPNTIRRIVRLAEVAPGDLVVEVGAGLGTLTVALSELAAHVTAIEIDHRLLPALREVVDGLGNVDVVQGDAMSLDFGALLGTEPHRLIANLPYNIATPLLADLLEDVPAIVDFVVMVQREVGERLVAPPGSPAYGAVSVLVASHATATLLGRVPPSVFWPPPAVDSVLVRVTRRQGAVPEDLDRGELMDVVRAAFGQRRKTVRNSLASVLSLPPGDVEAVLAAARIDPGARGETLDLDAFVRLTFALSSAPQSRWGAA